MSGADGVISFAPPKTTEEALTIQREEKVRTILLQAIPIDYLSDFHFYIDARDLWLAIQAKFGGNDDSKRMRKATLRQQFQDFRVSEEEGIHKGYDRFHKILSGLNQLKAKPDNEDCNAKFLRSLPPSWLQVSISMKTRGGLDLMTFDDMYNKLKGLESDVRSPIRGTAPTYGAFVSTHGHNSTYESSPGSSSGAS